MTHREHLSQINLQLAKFKAIQHAYLIGDVDKLAELLNTVEPSDIDEAIGYALGMEALANDEHSMRVA